MSKTTDWLPGTRTAQLAMAQDWKAVCTARQNDWGIPNAALTDLTALIQTAETALATAQNETTRTPVATAQCKTAFEALVEKMRDTKCRFFLEPPLAPADFISLGLKIHDTTPPPSGSPSSQVTIETYLVGRHELGIKIIYVTGDPNDPANKGYRIWYKVTAPGETAPTDPKALTESFYTKRKKDNIEFDYGASDSTAHFAVQIENEGQEGSVGAFDQRPHSVGMLSACAGEHNNFIDGTIRHSQSEWRNRKGVLR